MGSGLSQKYSNTYGSGSDKYDASEVRENSLEYGNAPRILRESSGVSSIDENASKLVGKFAPNKHGNFGRPGKNTRIIECGDPISESTSFYEQIGKGGEISDLPRGNGTSTRLDDGTIITYRVVTSTTDSPAVQINVRNVEANITINNQKIHFIKENAND